MKKILFAIVLSYCCSYTADAQTVLLAGDYADPTILKDGNDYYMTHSPFHYKPGFLIWHSKDLVNWEPICRTNTTWEGSAWAPDLQKVDDTYYIYYPAEGSNWVITAHDIRGPWSNPVNLEIEGIDPGLAVTPDGHRYLFTNGGQVTPLTADGLHRDGPTRTVYHGWQYPVDWETECMCLESPKITFRNGWYYMTSAEGGTAGPATSHMAVSARSRHIDGPWENSSYNPIVHTYSDSEQWWSKGHGTIVEGPDHQWYIVYHAYNKDAYSLGRHTLMEPIEWTNDGWFRATNDTVNRKAVSSVDKSNPILWTGWKEDLTGIVSQKSGTVAIPGKGSTPADGRLITVPATDTNYIIETIVDVGKHRNEAGMLLFYNETAFAGLTSDGKNFTIHTNAAQKQLMPNPLGHRFHLRLATDSNSLTVSVSADGIHWLTVASGINVADFHHNSLGEFLALRPALCSLGGGTARFQNFKYISAH